MTPTKEQTLRSRIEQLLLEFRDEHKPVTDKFLSLFEEEMMSIIGEDNYGHSWACDEDTCVCDNHEIHKLYTQLRQEVKERMGR